LLFHKLHMRSILPLILLFLIIFLNAKAQVVINEICPANADIKYDPDFYNFSGWVELYNTGTGSVPVGGYYLSDDAAKKNKWRIPNGLSIPSKGTLLIWCDNMNTGIHASFTLDCDGEELVLSNNLLNEIDRVTFGKQYTNIAYGRKTDGAADWAYLTSPTPGTSNVNQTASERLENPSLSLLSGRYSGTQILTMSHPVAGTEIRFTTDGSEPRPTSSKYAAPVSITKTTTVKAIAFKPGYVPSKAEVKTFFINQHTFTLPVISISTTPNYLWDNTIGIYTDGTNGMPGNCQPNPVNWNREWDRHAVFEYFQPNGAKDFDQPVDIRIGGACSRNNPQKSIVIKARDKYGKNHIDEKMFSTKTTDRFGGFILRNSGNDFWNTMFRDALMQSLTIGQMDVDYMAYQPTIFYLNGEYWGIQNLREKIDADYIESNYNIPKEDIDLLETGGYALEGTANEWNIYLDSLQKINLALPASFSFIDRHIDVQEFINYVSAEIYYCNTDWPGNNVKFWRQRSTNGKFRWILWDLDFGFALYDGASYATHPTLEFATDPDNSDWPNPSWSTLHLRLLLQNPVFKERFIQTLTTSLHTTFQPDRVIETINTFQARIADEIPYHTARWGTSVDGWNAEVQRLRDFAVQRNEFMHNHIREFFNLDGDVRISVKSTPEGQGSFSLNGITHEAITDASYYKGLPYTVSALPANGYKFKNWSIKKRESTGVPLIADNTAWKYFDTGTFPSATWMSTGYDDSSWPSGQSQLGYGEGDEQTMVGYGADPNNKFITTYFRKNFSISDTIGLQSLTARILYDDGAIVYFNGIEVYRDNMPGGSVTESTPAIQAIPVENVFNSFTIAKGLIQPGTNTIAVEIHQSSGQSSDISFDFTLSTNRTGAEVTMNSTDITMSDTANSDVILEAFFEPATPLTGLVLNEICASKSSVTDENGDTEDWIELYNNSNNTIDISGLYISDDPANKTKHLIAAGRKGETIMPPKTYKILWADEDFNQGVMHLNFKLSNEGEQVSLYQLTGSMLTKLDEVIFGISSDSVSFSRIPNGTGAFTLTSMLTPLKENELVTALDENSDQNLRVYPNPVTNILHIESEVLIDNAVIIDNKGSVVAEVSISGFKKDLSVEALPTGLYSILFQRGNTVVSRRFVRH
jgi:hypothetical protein